MLLDKEWLGRIILKYPIRYIPSTFPPFCRTHFKGPSSSRNWRFVPWFKLIITCTCLCMVVAVARKLCNREGCASHESSGGRGSLIIRRPGNLGTFTHPCYHFHWAFISQFCSSLYPVLTYCLVQHCSCTSSSLTSLSASLLLKDLMIPGTSSSLLTLHGHCFEFFHGSYYVVFLPKP